MKQLKRQAKKLKVACHKDQPAYPSNKQQSRESIAVDISITAWLAVTQTTVSAASYII